MVDGLLPDVGQRGLMRKGGKPLVSVQIPTKNRADLCLRTALENALEVRENVAGYLDLEIIVVDDKSTDATRRVVAEYPVRCVEGPGRGVAAARNAGVRAATGEYIAFLDDDDVWLEGHLVPQVSILEARQDVALIFGQGRLADWDLRPVYKATPESPLPDGEAFAFFLDQCVQLDTAVIRREAIEAVGGFDEDIGSGPEDWDLELRIAARYDCIGLPVPVALWRLHPPGRKEGGADAWLRRFADTQSALRRAQRLPARVPPPVWQRRPFRDGASLRTRGWFAYQVVSSARRSLELGDLASARRLYLAALRISPVHGVRLAREFFPSAGSMGRSADRAVRVG